MLDTFMRRLGDRTREVVLAQGGHPLPNAESFAAGEAALRVADANCKRGETLVVLLSGGASAMMAAPAPGVTLEDKIALTRELLQSGLPIAEMNAQRKQLSAIKGGKLALRAGRSITYAISDVHAPVEDDPAVIGSGPTFVETPVAGVEAQFILAGSRRDAMAGAAAEAARLGYDVRRIEPPTLGEARDAANRLVASLEDSVAGTLKPRAVIASGETTVAIPRHSHGRGGRNQEFALAAALAMTGAGVRGEWALASVGTDGVDGPTDAAGAIVDSTTVSRGIASGFDPRAALDAHDSYRFFERLSDLVVTGPTGTNVGDLQVFLRSAGREADGQ
jgi:glycerate 2-kinase